MRDLSNESEALVHLARRELSPSATDRARVRVAIAARFGDDADAAGVERTTTSRGAAPRGEKTEQGGARSN